MFLFHPMLSETDVPDMVKGVKKAMATAVKQLDEVGGVSTSTIFPLPKTGVLWKCYSRN